MAGSEASGKQVVLLQNGIRESAPGSTQQKKEFAGPQKNVQQAAALQIVDVFAVQGYVKSPSRALFDKGPEVREVERHASDLLGSGVDSLQVFVAEIDEVIQAKILLSQ
ncbi:MAG: hypothetical protein ACHQIK_08840 [Candidatus Acidiferrales bacterium]